MTLTAGTKLGRYEIRSKIGEGGMGEVYLARDPKIGRDVAIKVLLPSAFSGDKDRLARFEQEAQAAGGLNHPNILSIYDVDTHDGAPYVVAELLQGETLDERMNGSALPARKALDYALQVASGLAAAHEHGIVHRDLKPENIFITKDGRAKILDFGLAKLTEMDVGDVQSNILTRKAHTEPGTIMGTVGYMSPEQVRGLPVDQRSDIFSFGAVLYEMLSGRRAFRGESAVDTLSAILREDPADMSGNGNITPAVGRLVEHCLEKNPEERFQSARDLAFALETLSDSTISSDPNVTALSLPPSSSKMRERLPWLVVGVMALALLAALPFVVSYFRHAPAEVAVVRFSIPLPEKATVHVNFDMHNLSVSPDGRSLAFAANFEGGRKLWVRQLGSLEAQALPGTEGAYSPFWSPDSRYIAFFAGGKLKRIESSGTSLQTICDVSREVDTAGTWGRDGAILYRDSVNNEDKLFRAAAAGGVPTQLDAKTEWARWPQFLPDGRHFLFYQWNKQDVAARGIYVGSLDSPDPILLLRTPMTRVEYAQGHLLFVSEGTLLAQIFDAKSLQLSGEPVTVVEGIPYFDQTGWAEFSVSENGVLGYLIKRPAARLVWLDRSGRETGQTSAPAGWYEDVRLSPDGQRIALTLADERKMSGDIWIHDVARATDTRFAFGPNDDSTPVWSPDGRRLAYFSCCEGASTSDVMATLRVKDVTDTGKGQTPIGPGFQSPSDWSLDGRFILYTEASNAMVEPNLWVLTVDNKDTKPYPLFQSPFRNWDARFSPMGTGSPSSPMRRGAMKSM